MLKGMFLESCRIDGPCPLWFGKDLSDAACVNFETWEIKEGHIGGVDMKGIIIVRHQDGIGPKFADRIKPGGIAEGAAYISDNATKEQRKILEPFVKNHLGAELWRKCLGVKFVPISIDKGKGTYHVRMPYGEQKMTLTVGGDGKNPIIMANPKRTNLSNVWFANTDIWTFHDYGKKIEYHDKEGNVADFNMQGTL